MVGGALGAGESDWTVLSGDGAVLSDDPIMMTAESPSLTLSVCVGGGGVCEN